MTRPTNDQYYLQMLALVASRSTCRRRQVGAIIVDARHRVLSMGFNGVPAGFLHCGETCHKITIGDPKGWHGLNLCEHKNHLECQGVDDPKGDTRRCLAVHAELNAILTCHRLDLAHTLYVSCSPCKSCALAICNTPIRKIITLELYADDSRDVLHSAHIELLTIPLNRDTIG